MSVCTLSTRADERTARHEQILARALQENAGPRDWRMWKQAAAQSLVELANQASRMEVLDIHLVGEFYAVYRIAMPVPRWPRRNTLQLGHEAVFDLLYDESWRRTAPPPTMPLGMFFPPDVFHPNCRPAPMPLPVGVPLFDSAPRVSVCLGRLQPNVSVKQLVLMGHDLVSLQALMLDETDPHGVFNPYASEFFRHRAEAPALYPLGLLEPWPPGDTP